VPKAFAPRELVKVFESGEQIVLPPWDPMVSVAAIFLEIISQRCTCRDRWLDGAFHGYFSSHNVVARMRN